MSNVRHKVFISYHHADQNEVDAFINEFDKNRDIFITRAIGIEKYPDIIDSQDTSYVMRRIRELYLNDSTVTIVLIGKCTSSRRYVDWEIQSSLRNTEYSTPNGLIGIKLKSYNKNGYPNRLNLNLLQDGLTDCYARTLEYPTNAQTLFDAIEDAYNARSNRSRLIVNPRERMLRNNYCI